MNKNIYRLDWDLRTKDDIISWLRCRNLAQKFIYYWEWANNYLDYVNLTFLKWWNIGNNDFNINPWEKILNSLDINTEIKQIYIWVACWDSSREIAFLKNLHSKNIKYIWIDSSEEMIEASDANLKKENIDYSLIRADIFNPNLMRYLESLLESNHEKSFLFFWWTFWNFNTTNIADLIWSFMKNWERLYIDSCTKDTSSESDFILHEHYLNKVKNEIWKKALLSWFTHVGFPVEKWDITIHTKRDDQIWLFWVEFYLALNKDVEFYLNKKCVIFSKWEEILFFQVIFYEIDKLVKFMKLHHFNFISKDLDNWVLWQFLFEKE